MVHICDMAFRCVTRLRHKCDMTPSYVSHGSLMTQSYVCRDSRWISWCAKRRPFSSSNRSLIRTLWINSRTSASTRPNSTVVASLLFVKTFFFLETRTSKHYQVKVTRISEMCSNKHHVGEQKKKETCNSSTSWEILFSAAHGHLRDASVFSCFPRFAPLQNSKSETLD